MPAVVSPAMPSFVPRIVQHQKAPGSLATGRYDRDAVLLAIPDKVALVSTWGLRIAGRGPNSKGWWNCHSIDRPDANPSASFHGETGMYWECHADRKLGLYDLAVELGIYPTWLDALQALGAEFVGPSHTGPGSPAQARPLARTRPGNS
jgi:hypothetical protein